MTRMKKRVPLSRGKVTLGGGWRSRGGSWRWGWESVATVGYRIWVIPSIHPVWDWSRASREEDVIVWTSIKTITIHKVQPHRCCNIINEWQEVNRSFSWLCLEGLPPQPQERRPCPQWVESLFPNVSLWQQRLWRNLAICWLSRRQQPRPHGTR